MQQVDLTHLIDYFPWSEVYQSLGYAMPYPEVLMTSDRAYAFQTQVAGLLMMQSWGSGNSAAYTLARAEATHEAYTLDLHLNLETIDEAWEVIGISAEALRAYMSASLLGYVLAKPLGGRPFKVVPLAEGRYMLVAE